MTQARSVVPTKPWGSNKMAKPPKRSRLLLGYESAGSRLSSGDPGTR